MRGGCARPLERRQEVGVAGRARRSRSMNVGAGLDHSVGDVQDVRDGMLDRLLLSRAGLVDAPSGRSCDQLGTGPSGWCTGPGRAWRRSRAGSWARIEPGASSPAHLAALHRLVRSSRAVGSTVSVHRYCSYFCRSLMRVPRSWLPQPSNDSTTSSPMSTPVNRAVRAECRRGGRARRSQARLWLAWRPPACRPSRSARIRDGVSHERVVADARTDRGFDALDPVIDSAAKPGPCAGLTCRPGELRAPLGRPASRAYPATGGPARKARRRITSRDGGAPRSFPAPRPCLLGG